MKAHLHRHRHHIAHLCAMVVIAVLMGVTLWAAAIQTTVRAADQQLQLYMRSSTTSLHPGQTMTVQVRLAHTLRSERVNHVDARIQYPAALLEVTSISRSGSVLNRDGGPQVSYLNATGVATVKGYSPSYLAAPSDNLLATITFRAKATGTAAIRYATGSEAGENIGQSGRNRSYLTSTSGTSVRVVARPVASAPAPTPSPAPRPAPAPAPSPAPRTPTPTAPQPSPSAPSDTTTDNEPPTVDDQSVADDPSVDDDAADEGPIIPGTRGDGGSGSTSPPAESSDSAGAMNLVVVLGWGIGAVLLLMAAVVASRRWWHLLPIPGRTTGHTLKTPYRDMMGLGGTAIYAATYLTPGDASVGVAMIDQAATTDFIREQEQVSELTEDTERDIEPELTDSPVTSDPGTAEPAVVDDDHDMFDRVGKRFAQLAPTAAALSPAQKRRTSQQSDSAASPKPSTSADTPTKSAAADPKHVARLVVPQRPAKH